MFVESLSGFDKGWDGDACVRGRQKLINTESGWLAGGARAMACALEDRAGFGEPDESWQTSRFTGGADAGFAMKNCRFCSVGA
jgi:hypothetical protein